MTTENNPHGFNHSFPWVYEAEQGKYVEWEDYARLKAEVERLTKAGDAFSYAMDSLAVFANEEARLMARTASLAFNDARYAAKEGKQS